MIALHIVYCLMEGIREYRDGSKTLLGIFCQGVQEHLVNLLGETWVNGRGRRRVDVDVLVHHATGSTLKWWTSRQQFVGHHGQGVLVCGKYRLAFPLLWCHVGRGSTNGLASTGKCCHEAGNAKVSQ